MKNRLNLISFSICFLLLISPLISLSQEEFRKFPPSPEPFRTIKIPVEKNYKLSNGLRILFIPKRNSVLINLNLLILGGESFSPEGLPGLATFTANMLDKGSRRLSSKQIMENAEFMGGEINIQTKLDYTLIKFTFLEEYLENALDLLKNILVEPAFPKREIEKERRRLLFELRRKKTDSRYLAQKLLFKVLFPEEHPYHSSFPNKETLRKIDKALISGFYKKYYLPNNSFLIVEGNLNFRELVKKTSHYLNIWKRGEIEYPKFPPLKPYNGNTIYFIDAPEIKRPFICMGGLITESFNQDYFPLIVINQILGGTATSRLFMNLRESKGFAFDARSCIKWFKNLGIFIIEAEVKPEFVKQSIKECIKEIEKINNQIIPIFELEQAKYYLIGNFPLQLNKEDGFSGYLLKKIVFGIEDKYWRNYQENIMRVDQAKISSVVEKYFSKEPVIIVVGNRKEILQQLLDFEIIELYDIDGNLKYRIEKGM